MTAPSTWFRFWQPDLGWLNEANMTNYRSLNAMRIAVAIIGAGILAFLGSVLMFWRSTWMAGAYLDATSVSAVLMSGREAAGLAKDIFEAMLWFAGAIGGFAVGGSIGKRLTSTEHQERVQRAKAEVERAKKAPVVVPPVVTSERPAVQTNINMEGGNGDVQRS